MSVAHRVHALEDMVSELKKTPELSGNDFLPIVLKLDELMAHLRSVRELATRLLATAAGAPAPARRTRRRHDDDARPDAAASRPADELGRRLLRRCSLAERLASDTTRSSAVDERSGGDPAPYLTTVKDVLIQMLRNSAVHGIEAAEVRRAHSEG